MRKIASSRTRPEAQHAGHRAQVALGEERGQALSPLVPSAKKTNAVDAAADHADAEHLAH
jgi:hypothetical protein